MDREAERAARPAGASAGERLAALFDEQHQRLFRLACRLTADREEARDLVQETFLRAARQVEALPAPAAPAMPGEGWLVRTLVNLCRDHRRRGAVRARARLALAAEAGAGAGQEPVTAGAEAAVIARALVRSALAGLPPRRRAVVVLHEIEELPVREIAALLGIAAVTVRWHLLAARRELARTLLAADGAAPGPAARGGEDGPPSAPGAAVAGPAGSAPAEPAAGAARAAQGMGAAGAAKGVVKR